MTLLPLLAFGARTVPAGLPGGGQVALPARYELVTEDNYRWRDTGGVTAYRNHRSMLSGTSECDGMIAVARADRHTSLDAFVSASRAMLTNRWSVADETEGRWYGKEDTKLPVERREGPEGPEISGVLSVHMVGTLRVYDKPGRFYAVDHKSGLRIAVWIFDSHGGEKQARKIAAAIAESYTPGVSAGPGR
ncbi:hypothetical protein [Hyphomonas sp.]|uniref:hypothetical protein n=1 Tax=Hyphomonas sp. TaxID=87 RepID=UPI00391A29C5